tara:strand:+ start:1187 stop:1540 length:354 start_codon:yes stop_codon:yes gene_type:complete
MTAEISFDDFAKISLCAGTIIRAEINDGARKPAYKLWVDLGEELGIKQSSAQLAALYTAEELVGRHVVCVTNFPPMRIAGFKSEILVTGFYDSDGAVVLAVPDPAHAEKIANGARLA